MSNKRKRRAAPQDLYRHCLAGGDCIPDVQNKYEQKTWADTLLKIFGSLLYFGNLGIGTGRGSGGSLGYRPLDSVGGGKATPITPSRPNITVEAVGPTDIITIDASAPSIVPLSEGTIDVNIVAPDGGPGLGAEEIELYTVTTPTTDVGGSGTAPTVISTEEGAVAVLDAQPIPERPVQVYFDPDVSATQTLFEFQALPGTATDVNVFVDPSFSGTTIGTYEEIPLERLDFAQFDIEEPPLESTPVQKLERFTGRAKDFYNKYIKQVPVPDPEFLTQPTRLAQFEFENPAFDADVSVQFERDLADITAAPNIDFADIIKLSRPELSEYNRTIRVSRLGETAVRATRSGNVITQRVHYFHDLSEIPSLDMIEMQVLDDTHFPTVPTTIVDDILAERDPFDDFTAAVSETDLADTYFEDFNNARIIITTDEMQETSLVSVITPKYGIFPLSPDVTDNIATTANNIDFTSVIFPWRTIDPAYTPYDYFEVFNDYYLNPAYYPRRKRRRLDVF